MPGSSEDRRRDRMQVLVKAATIAVCGLLVACCASESYQSAAMQASESGDQKAAIRLAKKEVARFSEPDQCSHASRINCGTLALAYGTLAGYQVLDGDSSAAEKSFTSAKWALNLTEPENRASATAMVYRDVSEAFWKVGNRARATSVLNEGRAAGADKWLYMSSAARAADRQPVDPQPTELH